MKNTWSRQQKTSATRTRGTRSSASSRARSVTFGTQLQVMENGNHDKMEHKRCGDWEDVAADTNHARIWRYALLSKERQDEGPWQGIPRPDHERHGEESAGVGQIVCNVLGPKWRAKGKGTFAGQCYSLRPVGSTLEVDASTWRF